MFKGDKLKKGKQQEKRKNPPKKAYDNYSNIIKNNKLLPHELRTPIIYFNTHHNYGNLSTMTP